MVAYQRCRFAVLLFFIAAFAATSHPHPACACDPSGSDSAALTTARTSIDTTCPCDTAASHRAYVACAGNTVAAEIDASRLDSTCRRDALRYARRSRCGRSGAEVCCRISTSGHERHRVVSDAAACHSTSYSIACISSYQSIVKGCDENGCVPAAVCGNGMIETGEECDPPDLYTCDSSCKIPTCTETPTDCGNGVVDPGEACEPPGTATCDRHCGPAACPPAPSGEVLLACLDDEPDLGIASNATEYLAAWSARLHRDAADVLGRRLDGAGVPVDGGPVVMSKGVACGSMNSYPAVASDGHDYGVAWHTLTPLPGGPMFEVLYAREVSTSGSVTGSPIELASQLPIGSCRANLVGPVASAAMAVHQYAVLWRETASCAPGGIILQDPAGAVVPLPDGTPLTGLSLGFGTTTPPGVFSGGPATLATLATDTLAAWPASLVSDTLSVVPGLAGAWTGADGSVTQFSLGVADWVSGRGPTVSAGASAFLVAWADRTGADASTLIEIRARRVTRVDGPLDPDGGILLAVASGTIAAGPVAAFDGTNWAVAWIETNGATYDLRAVAVRTDGSVVYSVPRLLAAGVDNVMPAIASTHDGRAIVVFARVYSSTTFAVHTVLMTGG